MTMEIQNQAEIAADSFGMWITGLWGNVLFHHRELSFFEQKEVFFVLLERLLREGKVKFVKQDADVYHHYDAKTKVPYHPSQTVNDPETHWDAPIVEILKYLRARWPEGATQKDDLALNAYFYQIPTIIWHGEDGRWYGG